MHELEFVGNEAPGYCVSATSFGANGVDGTICLCAVLQCVGSGLANYSVLYELWSLEVY